MSESGISKLKGIFQTIATLGDLEGWWPGERDEVIIGAILTQQSRWENVELALGRLKERGICDLQALYHAQKEEIEEAIRPAGFYRGKTRSLRDLSSLIVERYQTVGTMAKYPLTTLRQELLQVHGIGPETADSILCFGLEKPTLVVDRYTERICACAGIVERGEGLKTLLENCLESDVLVFQRLHAQFVEYAKTFCRKRRCEECGIVRLRV